MKKEERIFINLGYLPQKPFLSEEYNIFKMLSDEKKLNEIEITDYVKLGYKVFIEAIKKE